MRDYFEHEAETRAARGLVGRLVRRVVNWKTKRDLKTLLQMSDYQLKDIGLTRGQLLSLMRLPYDCDFRWEMDRIALERKTISSELPPSETDGGAYAAFAKNELSALILGETKVFLR